MLQQVIAKGYSGISLAENSLQSVMVSAGSNTDWS